MHGGRHSFYPREQAAATTNERKDRRSEEVRGRYSDNEGKVEEEAHEEAQEEAKKDEAKIQVTGRKELKPLPFHCL
ncbi:hypothetical protein Cni_G00393 [Canna indica]|uniref:Uncharacterized protein n=1 Tax=Canna indica TaxID=4628 RepID=A0AAQ3Q0A8_9LILI|nr:hypothetical protein Cni_G00393 [Canna indica]